MPAKKRKIRSSSKININSKDIWEEILESVEKPEVPIEVLEKIVVHLIDGSKVNISIIDLLAEGADPEELEKALSDKLEKLDDMITDMDFFVNIDQVIRTVQPKTDELLSNL